MLPTSLESNAFLKSTIKVCLFWQLDFVSSAISLNMKICWIVLLSFLKPACCSLRCLSFKANLNRSWKAFKTTLLKYDIKALNLYFVQLFKSPFFNSITITEFHQFCGHLPVSQIFMHSLSISLAIAGVPPRPVLLLFFSFLTAFITSSCIFIFFVNNYLLVCPAYPFYTYRYL
jgi:hypothetical protein